MGSQCVSLRDPFNTNHAANNNIKMSYEIATSITLTKEKIRIKSHSNNVFPKHDTTTELSLNDENLRTLLRHLDDGIIQPVPSANNYKWSGIMIMLELEGIEGKDRFSRFKELATSNGGAEETYGIRLPNGSWFCKSPVGGYAATMDKDKALKMPKVKAMHVMKRYTRLNPKLEKL